MSWLEKLLPPKIQPTDPSERRTVPEGLWVKCPACETVLYKTNLEKNINVYRGELTYQQVAEAHGLDWRPLPEVIPALADGAAR